MNVLPRTARHLLSAAFAATMVATRFHHFGDAMHLPDASMALFFLGGLFLREHRQFFALFALAVGIDAVAVGFAGVSAYCITPAYAALLPAYAVLWYGGRAVAAWHAVEPVAMLRTLAAALVCAGVSFAVSDGAFYWLGGRHPQPNMAEYLANAMRWAPMFVRTAMLYVTVAMVAQTLASHVVASRAAIRVRGL